MCPFLDYCDFVLEQLFSNKLFLQLTFYLSFYNQHLFISLGKLRANLSDSWHCSPGCSYRHYCLYDT